jgi:hypothetical protein
MVLVTSTWCITTTRTNTLNNLSSDSIAQPTTQSLSIEPVRQKRASLNFTATGNYSTFTVSAFQTDRSQLHGHLTGITGFCQISGVVILPGRPLVDASRSPD